jgi:hypothetical protein
MARERIANPYHAGSNPVTYSILHKGRYYALYDWFLFIMALFKTFMIVLCFCNNTQIDVDKMCGCVILHA